MRIPGTLARRLGESLGPPSAVAPSRGPGLQPSVLATEQTGRPQEALGHDGRSLAVHPDVAVHLDHHAGRQPPVQVVDDAHERAPTELRELLLVDHQRDVLEAEQALAVLQHLVAPARELAVGAEHIGGVDLLAIERPVLLADRDRAERDAVEPVDLAHPSQALPALLELGPRAEREPRQRTQVADGGETAPLGEVLSGGDGVDVLERRLRTDGLTAPRVELLRQSVGLRGGRARVVPVRGDRDRHAEILGIAVDRAALELAVDLLGRPDLLAQPHVDAVRAQNLAVQLADDHRLREVLRAKRQHELAALRLNRALAILLLVPARGRAERESQPEDHEPACAHDPLRPVISMSMRSGWWRAAPPATVISSNPSSSDAVMLERSVPSGRFTVRRNSP